MDEQQAGMELALERRGKAHCSIALTLNGTPIHQDVIDPAKSEHRAKFIKGALSKAPGITKDELEDQLLKLCQEKDVEPALTPATEIDIRQVIRPEHFFTSAMCGLTVPVAYQSEGKIAGKLRTYFVSPDGQRKVADLPGWFDLADGQQLWVFPCPATPPPSQKAAWSAKSRDAWLHGKANPDPVAVFAAICERLAYFLDFPAERQQGTIATIALWIMHTYCYPIWSAVPYLFVGGPMGSGKSRLLDLLTRMTFRPLETANISVACLFRTLNECGGVLIYDEAEGLRHSSPENTDLNGMLLHGYRAGAKATRLESDGDKFRTASFDVFGPKVMACIVGLPATLASRCISIMMFRSPAGSLKPAHRIDEDPERWQAIRDDLHCLALNHAFDLRSLPARLDVCPDGITNRNFELWQPILSLASWLEEKGAKGLFKLMRAHALDSVELAKDDAIPEADEVLLEVLADKVRNGGPPAFRSAH
jgi:hypothetical protein